MTATDAMIAHRYGFVGASYDSIGDAVAEEFGWVHPQAARTTLFQAPAYWAKHPGQQMTGMWTGPGGAVYTRTRGPAGGVTYSRAGQRGGAQQLHFGPRGGVSARRRYGPRGLFGGMDEDEDFGVLLRSDMFGEEPPGQDLSRKDLRGARKAYRADMKSWRGEESEARREARGLARDWKKSFHEQTTPEERREMRKQARKERKEWRKSGRPSSMLMDEELIEPSAMQEMMEDVTLFGADPGDLEDEGFDVTETEGGWEASKSSESSGTTGFKFNPPPWALPLAGGLAAGAGLTALGFAVLGKKKRKKAAASYAGVDSRLLDTRNGEDYGLVGTYDNLGDKVSKSMFGTLGAIGDYDWLGERAAADLGY